MAIVKNVRVSRLYGDSSPHSRDSVLSDDDEIQTRSFKADGDDENDVDSGMDSDGFDLSELGEIGEELYRIGNQNCSIPLELYDLPDLSDVLSLDTWNNCLTEDERFCLTEYLPDMDQETFKRTLNELLSGGNFHFGSPLAEVFDRLKGGLCEPSVAVYQQGLNFFQKRKHYHLLRSYQNSMVGSLMQIRVAWENCAGYSIEERLRVLNLLKSQSQRSSMNGKYEVSESETDSSGREESVDGFWSNRIEYNKPGVKRSHEAVYKRRSSGDVLARGMEPAAYRKQNPKGVLKVITPKTSCKQYSETISRLPSSNHGLKTKPRTSGTTCTRWQMRSDDEEEDDDFSFEHEVNESMTRGTKLARVSLSKSGKKQNFLKKHDADFRIELDEDDNENVLGLPFKATTENLHFHGKNRHYKQKVEREPLTAKMMMERSVYGHRCFDDEKKAKYAEKVKRYSGEDRMTTSKERAQRILAEGTHLDRSAGTQPFWHKRTQEEEALSMDRSVKFKDWNVKSKKWKKGGEFQSSMSSVRSDSKDVSYKIFKPQVNDDSYLHSDSRAITPREKFKKRYAQNRETDMEDPKLTDTRMYMQSDETESDSSMQLDEDEDVNHSTEKLGYMSGVFKGGVERQSASVRSDSKEVNKLVWKGREHGQVLDGVKRSSINIVDHGKQLHRAEIESHSSKGKHKSKMSEPSYLHEHSTENLGRKILSTSEKIVDSKQSYKSVKNDHMQGDAAAQLQLPLQTTFSSARKQKGKVNLENSLPRSNFKHKHENSVLEEVSHEESKLMDDPSLSNRSRKKGQIAETHVTTDCQLLVGCNSITPKKKKKKKGKVNLTSSDVPDESNCLQSGSDQPVHDPNSAKKRGKRKAEAETVLSSDVIVSERGNADLEPEPKLPKKPFTLITPSIHKGFSFSIVHLLSAVRMAMITWNADDTFDKSDGRHMEQNKKLERVNGVSLHVNFDLNSSEHTEAKNLPSLTVQEIVNCVRSNPGDPCILETQEPLQDLVRGVLKIFSSRTAPLGAKGWKALVSYEKSTKSWSWIGPISSSSADRDTVEEETSPDAWGVPHKMLVKLVDAFANWLKSGQETLQQIGSLPAPPVSLMLPNMDEKERFRDLRAQKSLTTISPSSDEVRAYFRREEVLRYSVPDRAFSYTAADGRKSIVAPLRRCGGKPTSKARDHFMLKPDRPPHVTILCLVRDAAARLPGNIGTRADVCILIRDSQYIVEDVSDAQVNQVVSGALDRLHYERDPCVLFDGERKLWVYLHRDREEEDFEDDGTSSTKKWKRPRKDGGTEHSDLGAINDVGYQGTGDQIAGGSAPGYDFSSDLNVESSSNYAGQKTELVYNDLRSNMDENMDLFIDSAQDNLHQGHPMGWEVLGLNPLRENRMLCLENSTNEDFDDETFSRKRPAG